MHYLKQLTFGFLIVVGCSSAAEPPAAAVESTTATPVPTSFPEPVEYEVERATMKHHKWDGFYFRDVRLGIVVVIHDGKYYNFERKQSQSFYIDFKYDIGYQLDKDGRIPLVKEYRLGREDEEMVKNIQMSDSAPIVENGETAAISYRVHDRLDKMETFREYLQNISVTVEQVIATTKTEAPELTDAQINAALDDPDFVNKSGMINRKIRKEPIQFWKVIRNVAQAS